MGGEAFARRLGRAYISAMETEGKRHDEEALRLVVEGTVAETGAEFFRALVRNLAAVMGTTGGWVTEFLPNSYRLRSRAFWLNGKFLDEFEHSVANTPCEAVLTERRLVHFPDRIVELYPDDPDLVTLGAVSYMGVPLFDTAGEIMGHLAVLDSKPMAADPRLVSIFEIFAARAAAECRRLKSEQAVRDREEELCCLVDSAMDGVLVLDADGAITRVNPAATRLFGCTEEDLLGENLRSFLPPESAAQFDAFVKELEMQREGDRQLWIPQCFTVQRWDKSTFPAEATLSRFTNREQIFYTAILRNVDDRLAAERRLELLTAEAEYLREYGSDDACMGEMLGQSPAMQNLFVSLRRVAATDATVLVTGETGTGKELIARSLHDASARHDKPLVRVNCAAIPGTLMESEFFGHERGAFTGATARREGRFALADGGTIFLDEVGELPLDLQAKLLRVLQEGEFEPLGTSRTQKVDVRIVAATNRDLCAMVADCKFREDLFYRLNVFPVHVPPLRERIADIGLLANVFLERFSRRMGRRLEPLHPDDVRLLQSYSWPGNVRELQNVIERALILSAGGRLALHRALPEAVTPPSESTSHSGGSAPRILTAEEFQALERANFERALAATDGKISGCGGAAELLGLPASTVASRMKSLGLKRRS